MTNKPVTKRTAMRRIRAARAAIDSALEVLDGVIDSRDTDDIFRAACQLERVAMRVRSDAGALIRADCVANEPLEYTPTGYV